MSLIRTKYRISTTLLSVFGIVLTTLVFVFSSAKANKTQIDTLSSPVLGPIKVVKNSPGNLLDVLQTARLMSAVQGNVTFTKPAVPPKDVANPVARHSESVRSGKQKKLQQLLAYHKITSGSIISGGTTNYEIAAAIDHQPNPPTVSDLQAKAKMAQARLSNRESTNEKNGPLL